MKSTGIKLVILLVFLEMSSGLFAQSIKKDASETKPKVYPEYRANSFDELQRYFLKEENKFQMSKIPIGLYSVMHELKLEPDPEPKYFRLSGDYSFRLNTLNFGISYSPSLFKKDSPMRFYIGPRVGIGTNECDFLYKDGDGTFTFNNANLLEPVYHPGTSDCSNETATLCLTAFALEGCEDVTDCMTLTIDPDTIPVGKIMPDCIRLSLLPGEEYKREIVIQNKTEGTGSLNFKITNETLPGWLTLDKTMGNVPPGTESIISLTINATGLSSGVYSTVLEITTNDPNLLQVDIPVTLTVITAADTINCQRIPLRRGWSYISSYIQPNVPQLEIVFENQVICNTMVILVDKTGIFWPSQNINTIGNFTPNMGYKVKMNVNDQWIICGQPVVNKTVNIPNGFCYLPVLSSCPVSSQDIFEQIEDVLIYAFNLEFGGIWWPAGGLFTLNTLLPGRGYYLSTNNPGQITYPECDGDNMDFIPTTGRINDDPFRIESTGSQHIVSVHSSTLAYFNTGDVIAVFNQDGKCTGRAIIEDKNQNLGLIIQGDDFTTDNVDGMLENEPIRMKLIKSNTKEEIDLVFEFDPLMPNYLPVFVNNGLSMIKSLTSATTHQTEDDQPVDNVRIFPNPAKDEIFVSTDMLPDDNGTLSIFGLDGQLKKTIELKSNHITVNISNLPVGVYVVKVVINGNSFNKRLVKQ